MHWSDAQTYTGRVFELEAGKDGWDAPDGTRVALDHEAYIGASRFRMGMHFSTGAVGLSPVRHAAHAYEVDRLGEAVLSLLRAQGSTSLIATREDIDSVTPWGREWQPAPPAKAAAELVAIVAQRALLQSAPSGLLPREPDPDEWLGIIPPIDDEWRDALPDEMQQQKRRYVLILPPTEAGKLKQSMDSNGGGAQWSCSSLGLGIGTFDVMAASVAVYSASVTQPVLFPVPALCFAYEKQPMEPGQFQVTVAAVPTMAIAHARAFGRKTEEQEAAEEVAAAIAAEQRMTALVAPREHTLITDRSSLRARLAARRAKRRG